MGNMHDAACAHVLSLPPNWQSAGRWENWASTYATTNEMRQEKKQVEAKKRTRANIYRRSKRFRCDRSVTHIHRDMNHIKSMTRIIRPTTVYLLNHAARVTGLAYALYIYMGKWDGFFEWPLVYRRHHRHVLHVDEETLLVSSYPIFFGLAFILSTLLLSTEVLIHMQFD